MSSSTINEKKFNTTLKRICVVTGTRAEYGLLSKLIKIIQDHNYLELQLVATGTHLIKEYGYTYQEIEQDGYEVTAKVDLQLKGNTPQSISKAIGTGIIGFTDVFEQLQPDLIIILGDRFEMLAPSQVALMCCIPLAHIHGGERTEGVLDESIRHAISKMAFWHFTTTEEYRNRVIQMGEAPERVFNVGALSVGNVMEVPRFSREELSNQLNYQWRDTNFLVTLHPETLDRHAVDASIEALLNALNRFPQAGVIITGSNADAYGQHISDALKHYVSSNKERMIYSDSLGLQRYLSVVDQVDVVIGNSSSGLIEVPVCRKPTVNMGNRQQGRICPDSVIQCNNNASAIEQAIQTALSEKHKKIIANMTLPYGEGDTAQSIVSIIENKAIEKPLIKPFFDLPHTDPKGHHSA